MPKPTTKIRWSEDSQPHDYPAALSYLTLLYPPKQAKAIVAKLKEATHTKFASKDISRASALPVLGISNSHVESDRNRIRNGERLSPILLVRDVVQGRLVIADGYHRLCAVYSFDENALIRCKICGL
jgi:disulfide oxidoreductase YuzD